MKLARNNTTSPLFIVIIIFFVAIFNFLLACGGASPEQTDDNEIQTETDLDADGIIDEADNCPDDANPNQEDKDKDGIGDICDPVDNTLDESPDPNSKQCPEGLSACEEDADCAYGQQCGIDGCCERKRFLCTDPEASLLNCGNIEDGQDCGDFDLFGTCDDTIGVDFCCGQNACQKGLGNWGGINTCAAIENGVAGSKVASCEELAGFGGDSASCQTVSDPEDVVRDEICCVAECKSGFSCGHHDQPGDPDDYCKENYNPTSAGCNFLGCCKVACQGDEGKICAGDQDCQGLGEKCIFGCCEISDCTAENPPCSIHDPNACNGIPRNCFSTPPNRSFCCISDRDGDGQLDDFDNCPDDYNPSQIDSDGDGIGDVCDPD